jgi:hypothetical protein
MDVAFTDNVVVLSRAHRPLTPWYVEPQVTVHFTPTIAGPAARVRVKNQADRRQQVSVEFTTLPFGIMFTKGKQVCGTISLHPRPLHDIKRPFSQHTHTSAPSLNMYIRSPSSMHCSPRRCCIRLGRSKALLRAVRRLQHCSWVMCCSRSTVRRFSSGALR